MLAFIATLCYYLCMANVIEITKQKLDEVIYSYDPAEFMPIRVDGQVANWNAFALYKAKRGAQTIGHATLHAVQLVNGVR